jgi:hypothetical protein
VDESVGDERSGGARWLTVHDDLLRGLTHALSNRVGTIAAASYLLGSMPETVVTAAVTLRDESDRLDGLLQLFRLLPRRADAAAEPVVPTDMTAQACALLQYHPGYGDIAVETALAGDVQPAYADPTSTILALTVAIAAAQRAAGPHGRVVVRIACDTEWVRFIMSAHASGGPEMHAADHAIADDVAAVRWLLASSAGDATGESGYVTVALPTLQAARRAQRG